VSQCFSRQSTVEQDRFIALKRCNCTKIEIRDLVGIPDIAAFSSGLYEHTARRFDPRISSVEVCGTEPRLETQ
jgi:hypothetical protein